MGSMEIRELRRLRGGGRRRWVSRPRRASCTSASPRCPQTINSLERRIGARLLVRVTPVPGPPAGRRDPVREARGLIEHHDRVTAAMAAVTSAAESQVTAGQIRVGAPLELPLYLSPRALGELAKRASRHASHGRACVRTTQLAALLAGELDVGLVRDRPTDPQLDIVLAVREAMGVILAPPEPRRSAETPASTCTGSRASLDGLRPVGQPGWHAQVTAILRAEGIVVDDQPTESTGRSPPRSSSPASAPAGRWARLPRLGTTPPGGAGVVPAGGQPGRRRTWAVWFGRHSAPGHRRPDLRSGYHRAVTEHSDALPARLFVGHALDIDRIRAIPQLPMVSHKQNPRSIREGIEGRRVQSGCRPSSGRVLMFGKPWWKE